MSKIVKIYGKFIASLKNCWKTDFLPKDKKSFLKTMAEEKSELNIEEPPTKKVCIEEVGEKNDIINSSAEKKPSKTIKNKNVAMLLSYNGKNYYGMQVNQQYKTIESELVNALFKCNYIPELGVTNFQKISFQRAARTDKGVSAARQVVSLKLAEFYDVEAINKNLPEDIRVMSIKRVTRGFNSKNFCSARTYSYTLPSFALSSELHEEYPKNFRITEEEILKANSVLQIFIGSNLYHNFTCKIDPDSPMARRYIMSTSTQEPFIENGEEFITILIKGQSFMFHQIRKMVAHVIGILKGKVPPHVEKGVFTKDKYTLPYAPGLGLVLEYVHYDNYNKKFGEDGIHEPLLWNDVEDKVNDFRKKYIISDIVQQEIAERSMFNWILYHKEHSYEKDPEKTEILNEQISNA